MLRNVKCRFLQDPPTHLDSTASVALRVYVPARTLFVLLAPPRSVFSRVRTHARTPELTRCGFPDLLMSRDLCRSLKYVFHNPVERPMPHTVPLYRLLTSPLRVCSSRSYRIANRIGLSSTAKLDLTGSLNGRVVTCKSYTVIKRGTEKRCGKRSNIDDYDFYCNTLEKTHVFLHAKLYMIETGKLSN